MIVVSKNIRYLRIFAGAAREGDVKYNTCYRIPASKFRAACVRCL